MSESPTTVTDVADIEQPRSPHPPHERRGLLLRQLECAWRTLRILAVSLFCIAAFCGVFGIVYAPWLTASRCGGSSMANGEKEKEAGAGAEEDGAEDLLVVRLFGVCDVRSNHSSTFTNCSVLDPRDISLSFHFVQLTHLLHVLLILISCSLAAFGLFCCKRRNSYVLKGVLLSGLLSALSQTTCLALYLRADISGFFRAAYVDARKEYRFTGRGLALTLVVLSLALNVVAVLLQFPVASLKSILDEREIYSRTKRNRPSETSPLVCPSAA